MTLIVIIIDGKFHCSFDGILEQWQHAQFFPAIQLKLQTSITELTSTDRIKTRQLKIVGNVHSELDMTLALFCYDMVDPTRKRIEEDMHHYEREQYKKKSRH